MYKNYNKPTKRTLYSLLNIVDDMACDLEEWFTEEEFEELRQEYLNCNEYCVSFKTFNKYIILEKQDNLYRIKDNTASNLYFELLVNIYNL